MNSVNMGKVRSKYIPENSRREDVLKINLSDKRIIHLAYEDFDRKKLFKICKKTVLGVSTCPEKQDSAGETILLTLNV